ncbi:MAG: hypothetical protein NE328_23675 [Lentisphaeraceae bacterium]|nr:hypothetical protein [Lentisphaeraceae bacterium]
MKIISMLFLLVSLSLCSCANKPSKAEVQWHKFTALKIGKKLPCCNPFLEDVKTMPTPDQLKEQLKGNKKALDLLTKAKFNFKGGEDPNTLNASDFQLIVFNEIGIFLAGDGAVRELK